MLQNNLPTNLPGVERLLARVAAAERSQQKDIRISIQEAKDLTAELAVLTSKLGRTVQEIHAMLAEIRESTILEHANKDTFKIEQILESDAIWAVFYKGEPFNLKSGSLVASYPGPKYKKVSFSNPGHAHNLAKKLNRLFKTQDFAVYKLSQGEKIE